MTKPRKIILTITIFYTLFILYFMFFAFGRGDAAETTAGYTFLFLPDSFFRLPALSDLLHPSLMTLVDLGNIAAFIPFGILIPWLYRITFARFMTLFFIAILVLETIQALTLLGSFDINDAIQNTIGAAVGFGAYKLGFRSRNLWRNLATTAISGMVLLLVVWGLFGVIDKATTKVEGPFVAINEWVDSSGSSSPGDKPDSIKIGDQNVKPLYNMYSAEGGDSKTYTYTSEGETIFSFYYGISEPTDYSGSIRVTLDGSEIMSGSGEDQRSDPELFPLIFKIPLEPGSELKITIEGNEKVWDVGYRRMQYFWS
ncbi:VanZ family protein [Paenibacillus pabuli]|uniref:VanZ family protein n=1 Tax=Paenibacillus pabuli TaxID=1472 RepID=UPI003CE759B1